ncbi:MAG: PfkB family carbohydrate kinase [Eubacteriales bacterium]|nr:PfkB family carbohydrate kinase [Eubacteriales bacterium]
MSGAAEKTHKTFEIVGTGAVVYDTIMVTGNYPEEDTKQAASKTIVQGGGPCANALVACRKLGAEVSFFGVTGDDAYGQYLVEDFSRYGVNTDRLLIRKGHVSFHSFIILARRNERGTRTILFNRGDAPALKPEELDRQLITDAKVLHLDGNQLEASVAAAQIAAEAGVKVSLDAGGAYPGIGKLLPYVDFLIPAEDFVKKFTGIQDPHKGAEELYRRFSPEFVIVTQGPEGGFAYDGKRHTPYPPYDAVVVDSNGAGDVFHGAFITGYIKGMDMMQAANFASAVSALKCTGVGARQSIPGFEETIQYMRRSGYNGL